MKIEIEQYADHRPRIKALLDRKGHHNFKDIASEYAALSAISVYVAYYYVGEIVGFNEWITKRMGAIYKFYGYTEVIKKKEKE